MPVTFTDTTEAARIADFRQRYRAAEARRKEEHANAFPSLDELDNDYPSHHAPEQLTHDEDEAPTYPTDDELTAHELEMREIRRNERRALRALRRAEREASRYGMFPTPA